MSGIKRAALVLHGMQAADRAWLMAQLDEAQRRPLRASLEELATLGVPRDASLLGALFAAESSHDRLLRAPAHAVLGALQGQAPEVVALLLRLHPWPWREAVVRQWAEAFAARPGLLEPGAGQQGPMLKAALLDAVAARLDQAGGAVVAGEPLPAAGSPWWRRTWRHVRRGTWPSTARKGRAA